MGILNRRVTVLLLISIIVFSGCSINKYAMKKVADILTEESGGSVFTEDNDPEFVGSALPFAIKMYETLLNSMPNHSGLILRTGSLYIMYSNAFLDTPATMLKDEAFKEQEKLMRRAKNLYLRGRDILLDGLDRKYPGFRNHLDQKQFSDLLKMVKKEDAPLIYWAAAGWMGAFSIDPFDMELGITLPTAAGLMDLVLKTDPQFEKSAIHDFYISYYGSLPDYMGGSTEKARENFKYSVKYSQEKLIAPYVSLATSVSIKTQNISEFRDLLKKAVVFDPESNPENRLVNILNQRKAMWYLEHEDDFFLVTEEDTRDPDEKEATIDEN